LVSTSILQGTRCFHSMLSRRQQSLSQSPSSKLQSNGPRQKEFQAPRWAPIHSPSRSQRTSLIPMPYYNIIIISTFS
jgi:hypothetical protein